MKKKYDPVKEVKKITGTTVGVGLGTQIGYKVADVAGHGAAAKITPSMKLMGTIPTVQAGSSLINSLEMLGQTKKRKKKRR